MAEVRLELRILIYPEKGSWVAHCLEMDLPAEGKNPNEALKKLMDLVHVATSEELGNVKATVHLNDSTNPVGNPIKKVRQMATKLTSTVGSLLTPINQLPHKLINGRSPPTQPVCGHCGKAAEPSPNKTSTLLSKQSQTNPTNFSFIKKDNVMSDHDQDLSGDEVKLVEYSILSIKRDNEKIIHLTAPNPDKTKTDRIPAGKEVKETITEDMDSEAFTAHVIKKHAPDLNGVESKDLRVYFKVLARYPRPEQEYDKEQAASLKTIADVADKWLAGQKS